MVTDKEQAPVGATGRARPGRPKGRTVQGEATRQRLFRAAVDLMDERGFEATTLREIAGRAGVSHALIYKYFPSKPAVVMALYDSLTRAFIDGVRLPRARWRTRSMAAIRGSLLALEPHRKALQGATSLLIGTGEQSLFSRGTSASRIHITGVFVDSVEGATDAPKGRRAAALGRLLYLAHLGLILTWLLDRSSGQRATAALIKLTETALPLLAAGLKLPGAWRVLERLDALFSEALYADASGDAPCLPDAPLQG